MKFLQGQLSAAERQIRSATLVATLLAFLSLVVGVRTLHERRHMDLELLLGFVDVLVTLALAYALSRRSLAAAWLLLALATAGALYSTAWMGFPPTTILPQVAGAIMYARAIPAVRFLRRHAKVDNRLRM